MEFPAVRDDQILSQALGKSPRQAFAAANLIGVRIEASTEVRDGFHDCWLKNADYFFCQIASKKGRS